MKLLINATYLDQNFNVHHGHILIKGNRVIQVEENMAKLPQCDEVTDCDGLIITPGFVNAHFHSGSNSARGLSQEMGIFEWGNDTEQGRIQNILYDHVDKHLSDDEYEVIVQIGLIELLKQGVTSVIDSGFADRSLSPTIAAFKSLGLRAVLDAYDNYPSLHDKGSDLIKFAAHLGEEEDLNKEVIAKAKEMKLEYNPVFFSHSMENLERKKMVYEKFKCSSVAVYNQHELLNHKTVLFHGTVYSADDIKIVSKTHSSLVHCPESNFTTSSGIAPIQDCLREAVNVCLGTDWANTRYWELMRLTYQLLKINSGVKEFNAKTVFKMATTNGYKAMNLDEEISIRVGSLADFSFISLESPELQPLVCTTHFDNYCHNILMNGEQTEVIHVMINGEWILKSSIVVNIDEEKIKESYKSILDKVFTHV